MVAYKVVWTFSVLALLGCVLISTVQSVSQTAIKQEEMDNLADELRSKLDKKSATLDQVKGILETFEPERILYTNWIDLVVTIKTLTGLCELSSDKCSSEVFHQYYEIWNDGCKGISKLKEYAGNCRMELRKFCYDRFDDVVKSLWTKHGSDENRKLIRSLQSYYETIQNKAEPDADDPEESQLDRRDRQIQSAYYTLMKSESTGKSIQEEREFLHRVKEACKSFVPIYHFTSFYIPKEQGELDIRTNEWHKLGEISVIFLDDISKKIEKDLKEDSWWAWMME